MKKSRTYAAAVTLLVLALSLFSSPVMPAEHPWDSDGGGGAGGTGTAPGDTSQVQDPHAIARNYCTGGSGWFTNLVSAISTQLSTSFTTIQNSITKSGKSTSGSQSRSIRRLTRINSPSE